MTGEVSGVPGVVLAGGLARRMGGGDKPLREIGGRTVPVCVIERLKPQCQSLLLNANGDHLRFASFGLPVVADGVADHPGPLAGILRRALIGSRPTVLDAQWMLSAPGDCPFLPRDLVARLSRGARAQGAQLAVAASRGRPHPVIGLWSVALRDGLRQALAVEGLRKVDDWLARYRRRDRGLACTSRSIPSSTPTPSMISPKRSGLRRSKIWFDDPQSRNGPEPFPIAVKGWRGSL